MEEDGIDSFAAMFATPPGVARREKREARAERERRAQLSEAQLRRRARRTTQINFRCTPEFRADVAAMAKHLDCGIADVMERALALLQKEVESKGGGHA